jgi:hypothetical protein
MTDWVSATDLDKIAQCIEKKYINKMSAYEGGDAAHCKGKGSRILFHINKGLSWTDCILG